VKERMERHRTTTELGLCVTDIGLVAQSSISQGS